MIALILDVRPSPDGNFRGARRALEKAQARRQRITVSLSRSAVEIPVPEEFEIATTSAVYLPLPMLGYERARKLIERNTEAIERRLGRRPTGLYPPFLCFDAGVARVASELGLSWVAADEISYCGRLGVLPNGGKFGSTVFVGRGPSMKMAYGLYQHASQLPSSAVISTAAEALAESNLFEEPASVRVGELPSGAPVEPIAGSSRTWEEDLERGRPFPTWSNPEVRPLELVWEFIRRLLDTRPDVEEVDWPMVLYASCRPHWDPARVSEALARLEFTPELRALAADIRRSMRVFDEARRRVRLQNNYMCAHSDPQSRLELGDHALPSWHTGEIDIPLYPFEHPGYWYR